MTAQGQLVKVFQVCGRLTACDGEAPLENGWVVPLPLASVGVRNIGGLRIQQPQYSMVARRRAVKEQFIVWQAERGFAI